jgi:hypothetical protein
MDHGGGTSGKHSGPQWAACAHYKHISREQDHGEPKHAGGRTREADARTRTTAGWLTQEERCRKGWAEGTMVWHVTLQSYERPSVDPFLEKSMEIP